MSSPIIYFGVMINNERCKPESKKMNIVFDLDETLVVTKRKNKCDDLNLSNKPKYFVSSDQKRYIWPRPYLKSVLFSLSHISNIYLFTKATKEYTDDICDQLKINHFFKNKFYKNDFDNGKNLNILKKNPDLSILVDNLKSNSVLDQNFYHIPEYEPSNTTDTELLVFLYQVILKICVK